ncbi:hypothetical protein HNR42_000071 [Deinobacterium chartae]|uniref:Lipoprotein n=1 Tax=Deinobacterium chartae TaxID=521158 RepID=A0A841HWN4_9DEIO|nr:hypothetical protein [Deinobacterium chartae]MBB6096659.1 hypothetical protein [Deinobacterium chartae]
MSYARPYRHKNLLGLLSCALPLLLFACSAGTPRSSTPRYRLDVHDASRCHSITVRVSTGDLIWDLFTLDGSPARSVERPSRTPPDVAFVHYGLRCDDAQGESVWQNAERRQGEAMYDPNAGIEALFVVGSRLEVRVRR